MPAEPAADAGQAFSAVLVDELVRHGVTHAVAAPGSRSTPVALALAADARIRLHVRVDERSAAFLALGLARGTGRPVPVLCTSGTAAAHFHAAALEADQSGVPLLLLTADRPPELRDVGANQTVRQGGLYAAAVRWSVDVGVPEARPDAVRYWRSLTSRAVAVATGVAGGPAGPVHLNLPLREPLVATDDAAGFPHPLDGRPGGAPWTVAARGPTALPALLADRVAAAERGVVVAGDGLAADQVDGLLRFAAARGWPVVAEPHSNARRPPAALRCGELLLASPALTARLRPELVVVAGRAGLTRTVLGWLAGVPHVVVDRDGRWWDPTRTAEAVVRADPGALAAVHGPHATGWERAWRDADAAVAAAVDAFCDQAEPLTEPQVARDVARSVPPGARLVVASSMPIRDVDLTLPVRADLTVVANRGVAGIDGFVSTASGVALAGGGPTYALAGDLSFVHDVNGLAGNDADLTLVVVNNAGGGIFSMLPQASALPQPTFERLFGTPPGVDIAAACAAYGVAHRLVRDRDALLAAVGAVPDGVTVVEVRTDRTENVAVHAELRRLAFAALAEHLAATDG